MPPSPWLPTMSDQLIPMHSHSTLPAVQARAAQVCGAARARVAGGGAGVAGRPHHQLWPKVSDGCGCWWVIACCAMNQPCWRAYRSSASFRLCPTFHMLCTISLSPALNRPALPAQQAQGGVRRQDALCLLHGDRRLPAAAAAGGPRPAQPRHATCGCPSSSRRCPGAPAVCAAAGAGRAGRSGRSRRSGPDAGFAPTGAPAAAGCGPAQEAGQGLAGPAGAATGCAADHTGEAAGARCACLAACSGVGAC